MNANAPALAALFVCVACPSAAAQKVVVDDLLLLGMDDVEITPNGQLAVVRENTIQHRTRIYSMSDGQLLGMHVGSADGSSGYSQDTVAVTDTRAVVIGSGVDVFDLTNPAAPPLASHSAGTFVRDVVITPDGEFAAVHGGAGSGSGLYVYRLSDGAQVAATSGVPNGLGQPYSTEVDSVVATDQYAAFTSFVGSSSAPMCRVHLFELRPAGGGPPALVFETSASDGSDLTGAPHDIAVTPDGRRVVVRSELELAVYDIRRLPPVELHRWTPTGDPGPFFDEALDSVETTDERAVTLSKITNPALGVTGTQVELFNLRHGGQGFHRVDGSPHDLTLTPDGTRALVRTSEGVHLYDLTVGVSGEGTAHLDSAPAVGTSVSYFAGLDSIVATDTRAVTIHRGLLGTDSHVRVWDITGGRLEEIAFQQVLESQPIDLAITPDETKVVYTGTSKVVVLQLETGSVLLDHAVVNPNVWYQWNDGVAVNDERAVAIGYWGPMEGWISIVDIAPLGTSYCATSPNSSGSACAIGASGTLSVAADDLQLWVSSAPPQAVGRFHYGATTTQAPFGDGTLCVGGATGLPVVNTNGVGAVSHEVDLASTLVTPGSTWHFQFAFRDPAFGTAGFNASDGITLTFQP